MPNKPTKGSAANYQKQLLIINDLFQKKCELFWTNQQLKDYMIQHYNYTENTAQKYLERLWQKIRDTVNVDYENDLAQTIEFMTYEVQKAQDSFVRLQWIKEINKIKGLQIKKVEVSGQINHIETIKLVSHTKPKADARAIEIQDVLPESTTDSVVIPTIRPDEDLLLSENKKES